MHSTAKRLISLLLALTLAFSYVCPVTVSAATADSQAVSNQEVAIEVGESTTLGKTNRFQKTTWSSSDESVATVSNTGVVTGVAPGVVTITATTKSLFFFGSTKVTTYTVVVFEPEMDGLTVNEGETLPLSVEAGEGTVTWKSSDEAVATVDGNGVVTGVTAGDAVITATIETTTRVRWLFWWRTTTTTSEVTFHITVLPVEDPVAYFTVSFESNGGSAVESQTVQEGFTAVIPETPVLDGYEFAGWYADAELTQPYDFNTPVVADITLYAAWEEIVHYFTVSFESNGGSDVESQTVQEGFTAVAPETPVLDGWMFENWYVDAELTEVYDFTTPVTADITLYAGWLEIVNFEPRDGYVVTFMRNDESGEAYLTVTVPAGGLVEVPEEPYREFFGFGGWYVDAHCIEAYDFDTPVNTDLVLFAKWTNPDGSEDSLYGASSGGGTNFSITDITVGTGEIYTTVNVNSTAILYVEILDENDMSVLADASMLTPDYAELERLTLPLEYELPEYFFVRASLYDLEGELLTTYTSIRYTRNYQAFEQKTAEDYIAEGEDVITFSTQTTQTNFGVLADGVMVFEFDGYHNLVTMTMVETEDSTMEDLQWDNIYTIANPSEELLAAGVGAIVLIKNADNSSYMFKIGSITQQDNGNIVVLPDEDVAMNDFYKALKVDMDILVEEEQTAEQRNAPQTMSANAGIAPCADIIDVSVSPTVKLGGKIEWHPGGKEFITVSGELSGTGTVEIEMKYDAKLFAEDFFMCSVITDLKLTLEFDVIVGIDNDDHADNMLQNFIDDYDEWPDVTIPIPSVPGLAAFFKVKMPVKWELEAGLNIKFISNTRSGFIYDTNNGKQEVDEKSRTADFGVNGRMEIQCGPEVSLGLKYLEKVVKVTLAAGAGIKFEAESSLGGENTDGPSRHACLLCVEGTVGWYVEVTAKLQFCIIKGVLDATPIDATLFELEGLLPIGGLIGAKKGEFYFSISNEEDSLFGGDPKLGGGSCPNKKYRVDIKSEDENGNTTTGVGVAVTKNDGTAIKTADTEYFVYLYNGIYKVSATYNRTVVQKNFVVNGNATTVTMSPNAANGKISGKLMDAQTNAPVANASIVISTGDLTFATCTTDANGAYNASLPAGTYKVQISRMGYVTLVIYVTIEENQTNYLETAMMVFGNGLGMGSFAGTMTNAMDNSGIDDVKLNVYTGWNNPGTESPILTIHTDSDGHFSSPVRTVFGVLVGLKAGYYTVYAEKDGFIPVDFNVIIVPDTTRGGQGTSMSPQMEGEEFRIVLRWGENPSDLDSHFNAVTSDGYRDHVYYGDDYGYTANLDWDDTSSYGPETITVTDFEDLPNGFTYSVHDYSNRNSTDSTIMSNSGAYVEVYRGQVLLKTYNIPTDRVGTVWNVFSVDAQGNLIDLNTFENISSPGEVGMGYTNSAVYDVQPMAVDPVKDYTAA